MYRSLAWWVVAITVLVLGGGCSDSSRPVRVAGTVRLNGAALPNARVTAIPMKGGRPATGITDQDGAFQLTTYAPNDGAMAGEYQVTILTYDPDVGEKNKALSDVTMDPRKRAGDSTKPAKTTKTTRTPSTRMMMTMPAPGKPAPVAPPTQPSGGIPLKYMRPQTSPLTLKVPPEGTVVFDLEY